jgi:hypothetical protein
MNPATGSQSAGACLNGATQLYIMSEDLLRQFAAEVSRAVLAEVGPLLPPYSKYALPPNTRKAEFCEAIASGAVRFYVHRRIHYVPRAEWDSYLMGQNRPPGVSRAAAPEGVGEPITVLGELPAPANDKAPQQSAPPRMPSAAALLEQAHRQAAAPPTRLKGKGRL